MCITLTRYASIDPNGEVVRSLPAVLGYGAGLAVVLSAFDYTGGVLSGYAKDPEVDEYERKQELRKNRRKPIQETIEQLGEGRGEWKTRLPMLVFEADLFWYRHIRSGLCRTKGCEDKAKLWNRCANNKPRSGMSVSVSRSILETKELFRHSNSWPCGFFSKDVIQSSHQSD